ncbi:hypothetical protein GCM10011600_26450 [Pseudolysinimonas yzui]|uniref:Uncharacterized protein n=1 Tax=Pseudolysinimonas yzui TaxID=2708254 RepID=A0A8J3GSI8_9MICO|nr:hypothetical protein GCM10011600_26450 [Pseudolysinimonas yzui]
MVTAHAIAIAIRAGRNVRETGARCSTFEGSLIVAAGGVAGAGAAGSVTRLSSVVVTAA